MQFLKCMSFCRAAIVWACFGLLAIAGPARGENYVVKGEMGSLIRYQLNQQLTVQEGVSKLFLSFVVPHSFDSPTYFQRIEGFDIAFSPRPEENKRETDARGNESISVAWKRPPRVVDVKMSFLATSDTHLKTLETAAPFPLASIPGDVEPYLKSTAQVQADHPEIRRLARELTQGVTTEYDAVQRILTWVVDHLRYVNPPQQYDAIYALESGKGNCQNFSHLSAALMRASGIPVRIVNGYTLDRPYSVARKEGALTFKMGKGRHSWIEVWFPDLRWAPFDPQRTVLFVSNRFIRVEVGVDNEETVKDGLVRWSRPAGTEASPTLQESMDAAFDRDQVQLLGEKQAYGPKNILLTPEVRAQFKKVEVAPPPPPPPVIPPPEKEKLRFTVPFLFGNLEFPEDVDFAFPRGPAETAGKGQFRMTRNFLVETAEYVTSKLIQYAQVFVLDKPVKLEQIGLALHKFGGDGQMWIELLNDKDSRPGAVIHTSDFVDLSRISSRPGYRWVDFDFRGEGPELMPGAYWIALGYTGSPIVNWFYTYGKPVGPVEGTRYKDVFEREWSKALGYEFNYRVVGKTNE